ncbi:MAG: crossover junction endodeoxyribonuclease RuvC [Deinococcus sp.]|nr:crossover junction endodeoxyribonuclease RuvC [Deinococcus sp.]
MRVLGIDPGLANCGLAVIEEDREPVFCYAGTVVTEPQLTTTTRLAVIFQAVQGIIRQYHPDAMAVEGQYFLKQPKQAVSIGQARGVALLAAGQLGVPVFEYTPTQIKLAVVGYGKATKDQIGWMVKAILKSPEPIDSNHAMDALAVALAHLNSYRVQPGVAL